MTEDGICPIMPTRRQTRRRGFFITSTDLSTPSAFCLRVNVEWKMSGFERGLAKIAASK